MTRSLFRIQQRKQESSARRQNELFVITVVFYVSSVTPRGGGGGVLPIMAYMGRFHDHGFRPKEIFFSGLSGFRYMNGWGFL